jgi:hypothetical protein
VPCRNAPASACAAQPSLTSEPRVRAAHPSWPAGRTGGGFTDRAQILTRRRSSDRSWDDGLTSHFRPRVSVSRKPPPLFLCPGACRGNAANADGLQSARIFASPRAHGADDWTEIASLGG